MINFKNIVHCFIKANIKYLLFRLASVLILYCIFYPIRSCPNLHFHAVLTVFKVKLQLLDRQASGRRRPRPLAPAPPAPWTRSLALPTFAAVSHRPRLGLVRWLCILPRAPTSVSEPQRPH